MSVKKALWMTLMWVSLALMFNAGIYYYQGQQKALEFLAGYLVELSLSVDNIFVFLLIFSYFKIESKQQVKLLSLGIWGAVVMRIVFILAGVTLLNKFQWLMYIFGAFLVFTGVKLFTEKDKEVNPEDNPILKLIKKIFPHLSKFWIVLIVIETTDLIFAVDSIPAVLGITRDPFIVYTSNIFAILGLRAMYFALAGVMGVFHYLHYGLGFILVFVGSKMLLEHFIHVPIVVALSVIAGTLIVSVIASLIFPEKKDNVA